MTPPRVLVAGATGFLGQAVVRRLVADRCDVTAMTRRKTEKLGSPDVRCVIGDMLDADSVPLADVDVFVNGAAELSDEALMRALHVDCLPALVDRIGGNRGLHWIQVSSVGVYGLRKEGVVTEDDPIAPVGEYEVTKAEGEVLIRRLCEARGIPCTVVRPSNIFGVGMSNLSLAQLVRSIQRGVFVYFGDPRGYRMNYVHVDDVAASVAACLVNDKAYGRVFNVSDSIDQISFVQIVKKELGLSAPTRRLPLGIARTAAALGSLVPGFPLTLSRFDALTTSACYSTDRIRDELGFIHPVGVQNGMVGFLRSLDTGG